MLKSERRHTRQATQVIAFLFTDIEGSTPLWERDADAMSEAVAIHDRLITAAVEEAGGRVVARSGDEMDATFEFVEQAVAAARRAQHSLAEVSWGETGPLKVRMGIDVGEVETRQGKYFGPVLHRLGRMIAAGHGGQVLLSQDAARALERSEAGVELRDLGEHRFKGVGRPQRVLQLVAEGSESGFPPLRVSGGNRGRGTVGHVRGFELLERVGRGELGEVFRGVQVAVGRQVAVKAIRADLVNDAGFVRRFEAEAQRAAALDHLHVIPVLDFWRDPDGAYLVMRWLEGGSLAATLGRGPWNAEPAARLLEQIGAALSYAHDRGVVHGRLGASQVLLDADGNAGVSDFVNIARLTGTPRSVEGDVAAVGRLACALLSGQEVSDGGPLPTVGDVRPELPAEIDEVIARAVGTGGERIGSVRSAVAPLVALLRGTTTAAVPGVAAGEPTRNPYKGLRAFQEGDAGDFYGRDDLVPSLLDAVDDSPIVAIVGPSGSGKSSVVRAGLLPELRSGALEGSDRWLITDMYPGSRPFEELEAALLRVASRRPDDLLGILRSGPDGLLRAVKQILPPGEGELLLVIDQFEELFTLVDSEEDRQLLLDALVALADDARGRARTLITLRADFFDRPLDYPEFGARMKEGLVPLTPLGAEGLTAAIVEPASNVGLEVEPALVSEILADVGAEPGRLPLLQFSLTELAANSPGSVLTVEAYRDGGGVTAALARRADAVHSELDDEAREAVRQVFLRLITLGEGTEDTRRRVPRHELVSIPGLEDAAEDVLEAYGDNRLLSFDRDTVTREPTVEVAHEALLRHWQRLRLWVDEARDDLRQHRQLHGAAREWYEAGEDDAYLLAPARVHAMDGWFATSEVALTDDEVRYLEASRRRKGELEAEEAERRAREETLERRAVTRLRAVAIVLALGVVSVGVVAAFALRERGVAEAERDVAHQQERIATARGLASAAVAELSNDPERSILLALEAVGTTRDADGTVLPEAEAALRTAIRASHIERTLPTGGGISLAPDGRIAVLDVGGTLSVWDPDGGAAVVEVDGLQSGRPIEFEGALVSLEPDDVAFSPDGDRLVVADDEARGAIRDATTGEVLVELQGHLARPTFAPDGTAVAAILLEPGAPDDLMATTVGVWDADTGELVQRFDHDTNVYDYTFSSEGTELATTSMESSSQVWDVSTGEQVWTVAPEAREDSVLAVAYHPDDEEIAFGSLGGNVLVRAADDGRLLRTFPAHQTPVQGGIAFSADGSRLATVGQAGARIWETETGHELFVLPGHRDVVRDVALAADGERVATSSQDGETRIWDVAVEGGVEYALAPAAPPPAGTWPDFSPDGDLLATAGPDGDVHIFELATMEEVATLPTVDVTHMIRYTGDGTRIFTASAVGFHDEPVGYGPDEIEVWDAATGERSATIGGLPTAGSDLAVNDDGSIVAWTGFQGNVLWLVETGTGEELFAGSLGEHGLWVVAFTPGGEQVFVGGQDFAGFLDPRTGEVLVELEDPGFVRDAAFTSDGRLVTGGGEGYRLWDPSTGAEVRRLPGESAQAALDVTDALLATGHLDSLTVRDLESGARRFSVEVPQLIGIHISPDGRYLVANHGARGLHLHVLPVEDLIDLAEARVTRDLTDDECAEFLQRACP